MTNITPQADLDNEAAVLLPEREALGVWDTALVSGVNQAIALNAGSFGPSTATAAAVQTINVTQS